MSQDIQAAVDTTIATFGRIDVLVNNAGHGLIAALEEVSDVEMHQFFETNFFGALRLMRSVLPVMRQQGSGHIVNLSSTAGLVGFGGSSLYCGAKFALEGTSEALAKEVEPFGIKVTLIELAACCSNHRVHCCHEHHDRILKNLQRRCQSDRQRHSSTANLRDLRR